MNSKILFLGKPSVAYRSSNIIKAFLDLGFEISLANPDSIPIQALRLEQKIILLTSTPFQIIHSILDVCIADVVFILPCNYSFTTYLMLAVASALRKRVIVDFYISLYGKHLDDSLSSPPLFKRLIWKFKDLALIKLSSDLIFLSYSEAFFYHNILGCTLNNHKIRILPLTIDSFDNVLQPQTYDCNIKSSKENICWWGSALPLHGLDNIIQAMTYLTHTNILLSLCPSDKKSFVMYETLIEKLDLHDLITVRYDLSFKDGSLPHFLKSKCTLALGVFGNSPKAHSVMLNKIVESLALGVPVLTMNNQAISEFLDSDTDIITCDSSPESIAHTLLDILNSEYDMSSIAACGLSKYKKHFHPAILKKNLSTLLN